MPLYLVTPPAVDPVSLEEMKLHLRADHFEEDFSIASYIKAATGRLDGPGGMLGRCLIAQTWRVTFDRFPNEIELPLPPCMSVDSISYLDALGELVEIPASDYRVTGIGALSGARILPARGKSWPLTFETDSVQVEFTAGFGTSPADVPEALRVAVMMHAAHLYATRESVAVGSGIGVAEIPHGHGDLIRDYRVWSF